MKPASKRRAVVWGVVGVVAAGALTVALLPRPVPVDTGAADRGRMIVTLDHEGRTRVHQRYVVSAPLPGRVLRIELQPGDPVQAHETLLATFAPAPPALLDDRSLAEARSRVRAAEAALIQARATREQGRAESEFAEAESRRVRSLAEQGVMSAQQLESALTEAKARARALDAANAAVDIAMRNLDTARAALVAPTGGGRQAPGADDAVVELRSPIDGMVLQRFQESEAVVPQGQPLLEIANLATLEVIADFLSADAVRIKPTMPVLIEQWGGGTPLKGQVTRVEPSAFMKVSALGVEEQRVWVVVGLNDPRGAWQALGDGYRVEARVIVWERQDVLRVPASSLFRQGSDWAVFVIDGGRARVRIVQIGQRNGTMAEVVGGVKAGERVIVHPSDRVSDGVRVTGRAR